MDRLINLTHTSSSLAIFHQYAAYAAEQLPVIWLPDLFIMRAVIKKLHNVAFSPLATLLPEYWYLTR